MAKTNRETTRRNGIKAFWSAWGAKEAPLYRKLIEALPESDATPNWDLARALLALNPQSPELALDDTRRSWGAEIIALRQRALARQSEGEADSLVAEMMSFNEAPWRRWSVASPIASALFKSLDERGHREPYIERGASASLQCLMGFAGHPVERWIQSVARACSPEAFMASEAPLGESVFTSSSFEKIATSAPLALPNPGPIPGLGEQYARVWTVEREAARSPYQAMLWAGLGLDAAPLAQREASCKALAEALRSPLALRGVSSAALGAPKDFDQLWPLGRALTEFDERARFDSEKAPSKPSLAQSWIDLGASAQDQSGGYAIWEWAVGARYEMGVGDYTAATEDLMALLHSAGADFSSTRLEASLSEIEWKKKRSDQPEGSLARYFELALDTPSRVAEALELIGPWVARCLANKQALDLDKAIKKPGQSARPARI